MMARTRFATMFGLLLAAAALWTPSASAHSDIAIAVQQDGSVTWNLMPVHGDRDLLQKLERARKAKQNIHFKAAPNARYDAVAHVMAILQRCRCYKFGIILAAPSDRNR